MNKNNLDFNCQFRFLIRLELDLNLGFVSLIHFV